MDNWSLYYMNAVGWKLHPGYQKDPQYKINLGECARLATDMIKEEKKWRGSQQEQQ